MSCFDIVGSIGTEQSGTKERNAHTNPVLYENMSYYSWYGIFGNLENNDKICRKLWSSNFFLMKLKFKIEVKYLKSSGVPVLVLLLESPGSCTRRLFGPGGGNSISRSEVAKKTGTIHNLYSFYFGKMYHFKKPGFLYILGIFYNFRYWYV